MAVNLYNLRDGNYVYHPDPGSQFFRSVQEQKPAYQGVWIVGLDGKVLTYMGGDDADETNWAKKFLAGLDEGLKSFGPVKTRAVKWNEPLPWRGVGVQPDGKVSLALYERMIINNGTPQGLPGIDSISLGAREWKSFMPPRLDIGTEWGVPDALVRRFSRVADSIWDVSVKPQDAKLAQLKAVVEAINGKQARIRLAGKVESSWINPNNNPEKKPMYNWCTIEGVALYDVEKKAPSSLLLLFQGGVSRVALYDKEALLIHGFAEWYQSKPERSWDKP